MSIGVKVEGLPKGASQWPDHPLYDSNSEQLYTPASNMKVKEAMGSRFFFFVYSDGRTFARRF